MELEELKKSWNALDEHLKDKEFIKEEELEKLIRHADKGIHAIARLNIKLILISLPILILFLAEVLLNGHDCFLHPVMGRRTGIDLMDLPQEVLKSYPRNQKEFKRTERINVKESNLNNSY